MPSVEPREDQRSRIVDVAALLLRERGPAAVTTRGVAEAAGVQAPTIYRLFGDKDGLLDAVAEHVMATYVAAKTAVADAASGDPLTDLRAGWESAIDFGVSNPTLFALMSDPNRGQSPAAQAGRQVLEKRIHRVALTGRLRVSERRAFDLIQSAGTGTVLTLLSMPVPDPGLADAMYDAVLRQVLTKRSPRRTAEPMASVVSVRAAVPQFDMLSEAERGLMGEWLDRAVAALL